ncbi:MAG: hypothetical protein WDN46_14485 [Methylocella sp.]
MLEVSDEEAALLELLRKHRPGYNQLLISSLGGHWCIEKSDLRVNAPRQIGFGDTFEEAWSGIAARSRASEVSDRQARHLKVVSPSHVR